jgi:hypothetical protein
MRMTCTGLVRCASFLALSSPATVLHTPAPTLLTAATPALSTEAAVDVKHASSLLDGSWAGHEDKPPANRHGVCLGARSSPAPAGIADAARGAAPDAQ